MEAKPETTEQRKRPARKPYAAPTLVKRQKLGKIAAADTVISGTDTLTATIEHAVPDAFVQWCRSRDYHEQRLAAPYYISPQMTG